MLLAMAIAAVLCILIGAYPAMLYQLLPWEAAYEPYTYPHVIVQVQLLLFSALAFAWLKLTGIYPPELRSVNLDADWLYRRLVPNIAASLGQGIGIAGGWFVRPLTQNTNKLLTWLLGPSSVLRRTAETSTAALLVGAMLVGYLVFYYVIG